MNNNVRIWVKPSTFVPAIIMEISVPINRDEEEYIDELLDSLLCDEFKYNVEWDFED